MYRQTGKGERIEFGKREKLRTGSPFAGDGSDGTLLTTLPYAIGVALDAGPPVLHDERLATPCESGRMRIDDRVTPDAGTLGVTRHTRGDVVPRPPADLGRTLILLKTAGARRAGP